MNTGADPGIGRLGAALAWWRAAAGSADAPRRPALIQVGGLDPAAARRQARLAEQMDAVVQEIEPAPAEDLQSRAAALVDSLADCGRDLLILSDGPDADQAILAATIAALCGVDEVEVLGWPRPDHSESWMGLLTDTRDRRIDADAAADFWRSTAVGAATSAVLERCAHRRLPVLVSDAPSLLSAVCDADAGGWWPAHRSTQAAKSLLLAHAGRTATLDLDLPPASGLPGLILTALMTALAGGPDEPRAT